MDPTKTMSYRRWRIKLAEKGISNIIQGLDESFKEPHKLTPTIETGTSWDKRPLQVFSAQDQGHEVDSKKLLKQLEKEYRKTSVFRKEKVAQLKKMIKSGLYHVPGKDVVDKWFPADPESETR